MIPFLIIMVTGGRDFGDYVKVRKALAPYAAPGNVLIQGGARGADTVAYKVWTEDFELASITVPAKWSEIGRPAGQARNHQMVAGNSIAPHGYLVPDVVIAFPGGKGTEHAVKEAEKYGINVVFA